MGYPTTTNTFASGTTAIASQWNTNFTDIINGLSDGAKDINFNNLNAVGGLNVAGDLYSTGWTDYSNIATISGWSSYTWKCIAYKKIGKKVFYHFSISGTGDTSLCPILSTPFTINDYSMFSYLGTQLTLGYSYGVSNATPETCRISCLANSTIIIYYGYLGGFATSAGRYCTGFFSYETT